MTGVADTADRPARAGVLVLVVGASGTGKDTLLRAAREHFAAKPACVFPQRYITRTPEPNEQHISVTPDEFATLVTQGRMAIWWTAHGLSYGIDRTIMLDLAAGRVVVCNASRAVIAGARKTFPCVIVIEIVASRDVRAARLEGRRRESPDQIAARLDRRLDTRAKADVLIDNSGVLADAVRLMIRTLDAAVDVARSD